MIGDLVEQRKKAREESERLAKLVAKNEKVQRDLDEKLTRFNEQRDKLYEQARSKANHQVSMAKKKADRIIHHLRQLEVQQGGNVKENELIDAQGQLNALHRDNPRLQHNSVLQRAKQKYDLHKGDAVLIKSYGQYGELLSKRETTSGKFRLGFLKWKLMRIILKK